MRRLGLAILVVAFCSAFQTSGFSGCGGGAPPPADLPPGDTLDCFSDLDCEVAGSCRMMACVAGACVDTGPVDLDFDGVPGGMCGDDCDDFDASRYPGAIEYCDGLDQDCDTVVDEEAMPAPRPWYLSSATTFPTLAPLGTGLAAGFVGFVGSGLTVQALDRFGSVLGSVDLLLGDVIPNHALVPHDSHDRVTVLATARDRGVLAVVELSDGPTMESMQELTITSDAERIAGIAYPGGVAITWVEGDSDVRFWTPELATPVTIGTRTEGSPDLAYDGARIVVSVGTTETLFVDPATGMVVATRTLEANTWAAYPLASDAAGMPFALLRDAFDHTMTPFSETEPLGRMPAPSVPDPTLPGRIDVRGDRVVVTRLSNGETSIGGLTISVLDRGLRRQYGFDPTTLGGPGGPTYGWDVALHDDFTAAIVGSDGGAYGFTLSCGL